MIDYGIDIPNEIKCLPNTMYIEELEYGEKQTKSGLIITAEKMDQYGNFVRPRWGKVIFKAENIKDIDVGDYIILSHGRWSTSILANIKGVEKKIWFVSSKSYKQGLIAKSKTKPSELNLYK